jgi:hypothetical protein
MHHFKNAVTDKRNDAHVGHNSLGNNGARYVFRHNRILNVSKSALMTFEMISRH